MGFFVRRFDLFILKVKFPSPSIKPVIKLLKFATFYELVEERFVVKGIIDDNKARLLQPVILLVNKN